MPKMRTNRAAAKRFRISGSGRVRRSKAGCQHGMQAKPRKRVRRLRNNDMVDKAMEAKIKRLLPYAWCLVVKEIFMPRVKRGFKARRRRNRILEHASGYYSARSRLFACAKDAVKKSWVYAYAHRKRRKRDFRRLWIVRVNAAARLCGTTYSCLVRALSRSRISLDRKSLSDLAISDAPAFEALVKEALHTAA